MVSVMIVNYKLGNILVFKEINLISDNSILTPRQGQEPDISEFAVTG